MAMDVRKPLFAALQAALDEVQAEPQKKQRHGVGAGRALLIGAGLYTAGRVVVRGRGRGVLDSLQERLPDLRDGDRGDEPDDDAEFDDGAPEGEAGDDFDEEEPEGEADEDFDDEAGAESEEEPEAEAEPEDDDAASDEPEAEAEEPEPEDEPSDDAEKQKKAPARKSTRGRSTARSRR